ncbi:MAG TPA: DUF6526 family protein [Ferruginibacter sp.]|nr:DUF6526 family protein [Ferruginibacter sp.]
MEEQNYKNHIRLHPVWHFVIYTAIGALIIGSFINLCKAYETGIGLYSAALICLIGLILIGMAWYARSFALRAQDRAIRAEENLRYFAITGNLLDSKLTMSQIIALRFAPNNELLDLAHRAVEENLKPSDIKKAIQNWKADHNRV